jgi:FMN reductase
MSSQMFGPGFTHAIDTLREADGIVAVTPVYKAGPSGLFTSFFQVLDNDLLIGKPVILAATAGSSRHALVIDDQMRPTFAYLRTLVVPTSLFAATDEWSDTAFTKRIERAARELVILMDVDFQGKVKGSGWGAYQHKFGSAGGTDFGIDLESDLMKMATGGAA